MWIHPLITRLFQWAACLIGHSSICQESDRLVLEGKDNCGVYREECWSGTRAQYSGVGLKKRKILSWRPGDPLCKCAGWRICTEIAHQLCNTRQWLDSLEVKMIFSNITPSFGFDSNQGKREKKGGKIVLLFIVVLRPTIWGLKGEALKQ